MLLTILNRASASATSVWGRARLNKGAGSGEKSRKHGLQNKNLVKPLNGLHEEEVAK